VASAAVTSNAESALYMLLLPLEGLQKQLASKA
jgi:hypothetical protein